MKIIIVGGGFGGLRLARKLSNKPGFEVVVVDRFNYHQFQPLFYQVATAGLDPSNISFPLRKAFHKSKNVRIRMVELLEVLPEENRIITSAETLDYDVLVLATGADTNFFGNKQLQEHAYPMKSTLEAMQLRNHILLNFENATIAKDKGDEQTLQYYRNIVVVGGGPTGVEVSGAIADMRRSVLPKDYPELDFAKMNIYLLEGSPRTLAAMSEKSSADSRRYLEKLGVIVRTGTAVQDYDGKVVTLKNGETIPSATVIWSAGIKGNVPGGIKPELVVRGNRIKVDRHSKVEGMTNIYAIGDVAYMETPKYPHGHPQVAQGAMQQADFLAKNLMEQRDGKPMSHEFEYYDKGSMATIGKNLAVVDLPKPKVHFRGFFAWLVWMFLHLMLILGVKNRLFVFFNWLYNYVTSDQSLRLILKGAKRKKGEL
ncbi:MAG: NAD(P)/FAD-dependent oxidoreductase [Bacteroidetes bacterium]|nr:NAD(P)/FAD-dependent oxidoreductase [Bacteroidota bacterium]